MNLATVVAVLLMAGAALAARGNAAASADRTPEIVQRALEFHGIPALLDSTIELTVSSKSGSFDVWAQPGAVFDYRVSSTKDGATTVHRHTNKSGEVEMTISREGQGVDLPADRMQGAKNFVSARVYFLFFPYRLEDPNTRLEDLGLESWSGRKLHKIRLLFGDGTSTNSGEQFLFWFDPSTARLEQFAYGFDGGVRFRKLVNYRRIGGILFADHENYAYDIEAPVDVVTPAFAKTMDLLSMIELSNVVAHAR